MKSIRTIILLLLMCCSLVLRAQVADFGLPFNFPVLFSGNFAELRSNHFHGGVDFKTQGVINKPIHAPAYGYISRVTVSGGGYGNALYVTHYNGYTTVYGHLENFTDDIARVVRDEQYAGESFVVDLSFNQNDYPVRRGDVIAMSGNTGYSFGPHLHFEVRETESNELVNPFIFYKQHVKDTKAPKASALSVYPRPGRGVVDGKPQKCVRKIVGSGIGDTLRVWGTVGFGVKALDYMDNTSNNYGVYRTELRVDGALLYSSTMDRVAFSENRLINAWVDYEAYYRHGEWFMRSHLLDNNPLRLLSVDDNRGWLQVDEERPYRVEYTLADMHGNVSRYHFVVKGQRCDVPEVDSGDAQYFCWDRDNELRDLGMRLRVPKGELFEDAMLRVVRTEKPSALSDRYNLNGVTYPLWHGCELAIRMHTIPECGVEKCYIRNTRNGYGVGGTYKDGWMYASISSLGSYEVAADTLPPTVKPLSEKQWHKSGLVAFSISDKETGLKSYKGYIDGRFVLFKYTAKSARLACNLKGEGVPRGRHNLRLVVTDGAGNETVFEKIFTY